MPAGAAHAYEEKRERIILASGGTTETPPCDRGALANARRKWLHYETLKDRTISAKRVAKDLAPIVAALEAACDEIDRLLIQGGGKAAPASDG